MTCHRRANDGDETTSSDILPPTPPAHTTRAHLEKKTKTDFVTRHPL